MKFGVAKKNGDWRPVLVTCMAEKAALG